MMSLSLPSFFSSCLRTSLPWISVWFSAVGCAIVPSGGVASVLGIARGGGVDGVASVGAA